MRVRSWIFEMISLFFFVSVILSCLPLLHSATHGNISLPVCPESFSCPHLAPFKYPFYNSNDTRCGLIKINCKSKGGEIQFGDHSYNILSNVDLNYSNLIVLQNTTFEQLVKNNSCEALMNNLIPPSPRPLLYSVSLSPNNMNLYKCTKNLTYFERLNYSSYNICEDHTFYYNYLNGTKVPGGLPNTCQVLQLPVNTPSLGFDQTNIFSILSSSFTSVFFKLSRSCMECQKKDLLCDTDTESRHRVHCLNFKKEKPGTKQTYVKNTGKRDRNLIMIPVIVGSVLILILSLIILIIWRRRMNNPFSYVSSKKKSQNLEDISVSCGVSIFTYKELEDATRNFDPSHELGDGGFGAVYYGKLKDGREVAVKKLHEHNYNRVQHFRNEVEILTKLRHQNLVVLYGCTSRLSHELLLVYQYVPNGTLADHLHGEEANPYLLTWPIRMNIAIETASALVYLHASEIIHRDVKTNNILLDNNFCVKVADFGLSRLVSNNVTHVSTTPQGTPGYLDPQYHQHYQLTDKSDVYSFGVVLIELISSMLPVDLNRSKDEISLSNLALKKIQRCAIGELIDPVLGSDTNPEIMNMITLVAELAFRCLQYDSDMRPTMSEVLDVLMDIQAIGAYYSTKDLQTETVQPLSETNDAEVLLKGFLRSPVSLSVASESTTLSINGDRVSMNNDVNT